MDKSYILQRMERLRAELKREHLAAFIFPSTDPHQSEYVPDRWKAREWISGFDGSAGTVVIGSDRAALWTDSRYFLAAESQLQGTGIELMRIGMPDTPSIARWLAEVSPEGAEVGCDGWVHSAGEVERLRESLRMQGGMTLRTNFDPLSRIWKERPSVPKEQLRIQSMRWAGETVASKLQRIRAALRTEHIAGMLVSSLDDIAWTLNLRGTDVHLTPVFVAYLLIGAQKVTLFVDPEKLNTEVRQYLSAHDIEVMDYEQVISGLKTYDDYNILMAKEETNSVLAAVEMPLVHKIFGTSPIPGLKAVKNQAEIAGFEAAMIRDGVALVKFLRWLDEEKNVPLTEMSVSAKLHAFRAEQDGFLSDSFDTIAGYEAHGAIVHYEATPQTDAVLSHKGLLLLDSGAHYDCGTTDITRTLMLGSVTEEQRQVYTLVLKAHIGLATAVFPEGACGTQLDALARLPLWEAGYNFMHGTGHGVGSCLCVHEGPHQIRMEYRPAPLLEGMVVTDEPGIYLPQKFGVRIENILLLKHHRTTGFGKFLCMYPLTLCPIETRLLRLDMLSDREMAWLNAYHARVYEALAPHLDSAEKLWLRAATAAV